MSRNNFINLNHKKLFESRLQIKTNSGLKINKIYIEKNRNKKNNISFINTAQSYIKDNSNNRKYNQNQSTLDNSFLYYNTKINSIEKRFKNNKFKVKNLDIKINNNKSNIIKKDINCFDSTTKNTNDIKNRTLINVNRRLTQHNSKSLKCNKKENKKEKNIIIKKNSKLQSNNDIIQINSMLNSMKTINDNNSLLVNSKNKKIYNLNKEQKTYKFNLQNEKQNSMNESTMRINKNKYNSFIIGKKETMTLENRQYLKNINKILDYNGSYKGRNIKINNKKNKDIENYAGFTKKNINNKNIGEKKFSQINLELKKIKKENLYNKMTLKEKELKSSRNDKLNINKRCTFNKLNFEKKCGTQTLISFNAPKKNKENKMNKKFNHIKNKKNFQSIEIKNKNNKNLIGKTKEAVEDNYGTSTKTNDEFASEKTNKINESSKEEESGILSMNEIEDIICYNDMYGINKEDNFLFYQKERDIFNEKIKKINKLFFSSKKVQKTYKQSKIILKKKLLDNNEDINKEQNYQSNLLELKILSSNNSSRKKKNEY